MMLMEEQDSKRNTNSVVVDRISALPNCILGIILSFLRTKQAVATSLLSKRWKSAWLDVHNLHFSSHDFVKSPADSDSSTESVAPDSDEIIAFIRFVNRALLLIDGRPLNKFRLFWHGGLLISSHLICWIDAAVLRNVCEIDLYLQHVDATDIFKLPICGFNSDSLRSLRVQQITFVYDTTAVRLPRLETLILDSVRFKSKEAFEKLIDGCPMLQYLKIYVYPSPSYHEAREDNDDDDDDDDDDNNDDGEDDENDEDNDDDNVDDGEDDDDGNADNDNDNDNDEEEDFMYIVSSPTLRHLDMYIWNRCTLKLTTPSVENLKLLGRISQIFVEKSLTSLVAADFGVEVNQHDIPSNSFVEAVRALEHAKVLTLSVSVMRALGLATTSLLTDFKRLVKLVAKTYCCSVQHIIQNSDSLEDLIIDQDDLWRDSRRNTIGPFEHSRWTAPVVVPRCLSKSLKKVRFNGYKGLEDQREMIRYILEHGTVLEVMQIHCRSNEDGESLKLLQKICEFPRKSPACKIQFSTQIADTQSLQRQMLQIADIQSLHRQMLQIADTQRSWFRQAHTAHDLILENQRDINGNIPIRNETRFTQESCDFLYDPSIESAIAGLSLGDGNEDEDEYEDDA